MNDYVLLEMRMAELMAQQEASGFRFDVSAAERVRGELQEEAAQLALYKGQLNAIRQAAIMKDCEIIFQN